MKFVLDTNVILKALIKNSVVRGILVGSHHEFYVPEYLIQETEKHRDVVARKLGLSEKEIDSVMNLLFASIHVVPAREVLTKWKEAERVMGQIDKDDVPFVAAAMSVGCGIWSDDRHLKRQSVVRVWTTKDVVEMGDRA